MKENTKSMMLHLQQIIQAILTGFPHKTVRIITLMNVIYINLPFSMNSVNRKVFKIMS